MACCDGDLSDGAFEEAVSEHDIGGWKYDPRLARPILLRASLPLLSHHATQCSLEKGTS